jgi:hypothetical protein
MLKLPVEMYLRHSVKYGLDSTGIGDIDNC